MEQFLRWFGPSVAISLQKIAQAGATGAVTALHEIPTGEVWSVADIRQRNAAIETDDVKRIFSIRDNAANGLTVCAGLLGPSGDNDLIGVVSTLLEQESSRRRSGSSMTEIPMRPDHGHTMDDELEREDVNPGYSYVGRLKCLAELRGVIRTLQWQGRGRCPRMGGNSRSP